jgi:AcrR family transcriptional regulator
MSMHRSTRPDPRVARSREAVLAAAAELLGEEGAAGFSIDAVARRSGVARTTIYRHWPEPPALLFDAFRHAAEPTPAPDTGSLRDDLVELYTHLSEKLPGTCYGRMLPVLLDAATRDPTLAPLHRQFIQERRQPAREVIRSGVERGEAPADIDVEALVDRLAGPVFYRFLVVREPYRRADVERLVDDTLTSVWSPREAVPGNRRRRSR